MKRVKNILAKPKTEIGNKILKKVPLLGDYKDLDQVNYQWPTEEIL